MRIEVATILTRILELDVFMMQPHGFIDVDLTDIANEPNKRAMNQLYNNGLIKCFPDKTFRPNDTLIHLYENGKIETHVINK